MKQELRSRLQQFPFPEGQYVKVETKKKQIVLHHTASGGDAEGDMNYWAKRPERVATCVVIDRDGTIFQCFSSKYWAYHLGVGLPGNSINKKYYTNSTLYDKLSCGIEVDNWGWLKEKNGKFYSWTGIEIPAENVIKYESQFRGHFYFEKYTPEQIESLRLLLEYWGEVHGIPLDYNDDIFSINTRALELQPGVYTHCSYRSDKSDVHPQPELIEMLKSLKS